VLPDFDLSDELWFTLGIPIGLVFFFHSSASKQVVAVYPSPAGPAETVVDPECWKEIAAAHPSLRSMNSDTTALLVNRMGSARDYYLAPIDECYKLAGIIRTLWRGFAGGEEAWRAVNDFFDRLKRHARTAVPAHA
jgi:hypothetical protein